MSKKKMHVIQGFVCAVVFFASFVIYLDKQNEITKQRLSVPKLEQEIVELQEEIALMRYQIEQIDHPESLRHLLDQSAFAHLYHPCEKEVLVVQEGSRVQSFGIPASDTIAARTR